VFGPVVTVAPFSGEEDAVRLANASRYGLGASVWTSDEKRARRIARQLDAGMVWTNDVAYSFGAGQAAWGGVKDSGFGRTHSKHGLYECSRVKFTDHDRGRLRSPCRMVDVGGKPESRRRAVASARVHMAPETARRLRELPKGDALTTAQLAGIMAAKRTSELIPLCHPVPLSHVDVTLEVGDGSVEITASAETTAQTGVEMEALVAASVAALTVYDMAKAIDKAMVVSEVRLLEKTKS